MKAWLRGVTMGNYLMPRRAGSLYESSEVNSRSNEDLLVYEQEIQRLNSRVAELEEENEELRRQSSLSHQARKMHGDIMPGDITHTDLATQYKEFFKYQLRHFPKDNPTVEKEIAQQMIPQIFNVVYEHCTDEILKILCEQLKEVIEDPGVSSPLDKNDFKAQEKLSDIVKAYSMLVYHSDLKNDAIRSKVVKSIKPKIVQLLQSQLDLEKQNLSVNEEFLQDAVELSVKMLTLTPPQIVSMPDMFDKRLHEIHFSSWKVEEGPYSLVYLRPILFSGRHGAVAVPGYVGNTPSVLDQPVNYVAVNSSRSIDESHTENKNSQIDPSHIV